MDFRNATELSQKIKDRKLSVREALDYYFRETEKTGNRCNTFVTLCKDAAYKRAEIVQRQIDAGELGSPLAGVPVALKDNISTAGVETTCASKILQGYEPVFNATVVDRLESAGMIVIGKLNMDEFAMGGSSETGISGPVRNPWDGSRVAGGSSGGSAAAVALGETPLALGTDTGGSIRQPCSFCSVTGIKPTYGAVSRYGIVAYASSLDQVGPIGRDIGDCAALLSIISGPDEKDSTCVAGKPLDLCGVNGERGANAPGANAPGANAPGANIRGANAPGANAPAISTDGFRFTGSGEQGTKTGVRLALPRNYFGAGIDDDVKNAVLAAAREFEAAGAVVEEIDIPLTDYVVHTYYIIACAEASSNLSRFDGLKYGYRHPEAASLSDVYRLSRSEGFGIEVKRRIMLGSFVLSSGYYDAYYKKALQLRSLIKDAYNDIFSRFDAVISPVAPTTAYKIGENIDDPLKMYMGDIYTVSVNLAGLPAAALPCGFDSSGLPVGFQLIGDVFSERKLIALAGVYQNRTDFHKALPGGSGI